MTEQRVLTEAELATIEWRLERLLDGQPAVITPASIQKLVAEVRRLRGALGHYADADNWTEHGEADFDRLTWWRGPGNGPDLARDALAGAVEDGEASAEAAEQSARRGRTGRVG